MRSLHQPSTCIVCLRRAVHAADGARPAWIQDVDAVREALRTFIGEVTLIPENGALTAEVQSAGLAGALQRVLVAGAGFEPATFGL